MPTPELVTKAPNGARISAGRGFLEVRPPWYKLLLRLLSLSDGCHAVTIVKDGESLQWSVHSSDMEK